MGHCPDAIYRLIEHFDRQKDQVRSPDYNETQLRIDFINPMFAELGWDMDNRQRFAEQYREVVHEDRIKVAGATKAPDYSFRIGGTRKFFLEAKKPSVNIKENWEPAYQLRRYAWSAKLPVSILTDFEELAIYDCRIQPKQFDKASVARREYIGYKQYPERWDFIAGTFSKDAVLRGDFDRYCGTTRGRGAQEFDDAFLAEIEEWRKKLANNLALRNDGLDEASLNFAVQRIIDRIIFLRIAEDRGTETVAQLQALLNSDHVYDRLRKLFNDADARYNSGLFHFKAEKGRDEAPDTLTPGLDIDDATLKTILRRLYYPESPYEFTVVSADILGSVYERFLGKVITLTAGHRAKIEEKPEVRKAGGVYYTPTYIVDYIVKQTVGKLLEGKTPRQAQKLKVLDPACGSGSFLIGAYQYLLDWHLAQHTSAPDPQKLATGKSAVLRPGPTGEWHLTIAERKRILLDNIHGVDLDPAAVEVTKLNLLLKCLEGETSQTLGFQHRLFRERALPDLGHNILCGNSLIGTDIVANDAWTQMNEDEKQRLNPFDYELAFGPIFERGGFDAVIGNPPYVRMEEFKPIKAYLKGRYECHGERSDLYAYFMERGHRLLCASGRFAMIVSNKFVRAEYGTPLRSVLCKLGHARVIADFAGLPVFQAATVRTLVFIADRSGPQGAIRYSPPPGSERFKLIEARAASVQSEVEENGYDLSPTSLSDAGWQLAPPECNALMRKLMAGRETLSRLVNGEICMGVKSGLTDAFVIDKSTRDSLISDNPEAKEIIKPLVTGRDVRRYWIDETKSFLIYTYHGIDMTRYPAVVSHLRPFRARLEQRATRQAWYELQQPQLRFAPFMDGPKLIFPDIATEPRFTLDLDGRYGTNTVYFIPRSDRYLLGVLNSRLAFFFFRQICAGLEGVNETYLRFFGQYLEQFPVAHPTDKQRTAIGNAAEQLLLLQARLAGELIPARRGQIEREAGAVDRALDRLVYNLYGLTDDEIALVEIKG